MASAWNIVRGSNYNSVTEHNENPTSESPLPDKFKQRFTMNSLRMSLRKRIPLKSLNGNIPSATDTAGMKKQKVLAEHTNNSSNLANNKLTGIAVEKSVKRTFYRVTEQLTGTAKKSQLKDTPQKLTPRTRYREMLRSPPDTPLSPANPFDSPCCSTPVGRANTRRRVSRTPAGRKSQRRTPRKNANRKTKPTPDEFSDHLELVSCGIQQLEANGNSMTAALGRLGEDYLSSPLQSKAKSGQHRLWRNEMKRYAPVSELNDAKDVSNNVQSTGTRCKLRRTMSRMSMRVRNKPVLRSIKSTSNIKTHCYNGPMNAEPRKLAPLQDFAASASKIA